MRVKIQLPLYYLAKRKYWELLQECFSLQKEDIPETHYYRMDNSRTGGSWIRTNPNKLELICNTEQFTKFIVLRDSLGLANGVKELEAELLDYTPTVQPKVLDVCNRAG